MNWVVLFAITDVSFSHFSVFRVIPNKPMTEGQCHDYTISSLLNHKKTAANIRE